jgi:hypothetical protein
MRGGCRPHRNQPGPSGPWLPSSPEAHDYVHRNQRRFIRELGDQHNDNRAPAPSIYSPFPPTNQPYFKNINFAAEKIYNFYNPNDGAVADPEVWPLNQAMKPDAGYGPDGFIYDYDKVSGKFTQRFLNVLHDWKRNLDLGADYNPYDAYAAMAYGSMSLSTGLGATDDVFGPFNADGQVDVSSAFGRNNPNNFSPSRDDHSGQFNLDNMRRHMYWHVLMQRLGLAAVDDGTPNIGSSPRP